MPEGPEVKISTDFLKKNAREVKSINIESAPYKKKFHQVIKIANKHLTKKTSFFCIGKNIFLRLLFLAMYKIFLLLSKKFKKLISFSDFS